MRYRYSFTPYPKGWYRTPIASKISVLGMTLDLDLKQDGSVIIKNSCDTYNQLPALYLNGHVFIYFDRHNQLPTYTVPKLTEFNHADWLPPFLLKWQHVRVHLQEIAENALDIGHFCKVHHYFDLPTITEFTTFEHQFNVVMHSRRKVMGMMTLSHMHITYYGLGIVVADVATSNGINLKVLLMTTPLDQEHVDIHMAVAIKKSGNVIKDFIFRRLIPIEVKAEFTRDIPVWEAKIYRTQPILCQAESGIIRIRKWAQQFYG